LSRRRTTRKKKEEEDGTFSGPVTERKGDGFRVQNLHLPWGILIGEGKGKEKNCLRLSSLELQRRPRKILLFFGLNDFKFGTSSASRGWVVRPLKGGKEKKRKKVLLSVLRSKEREISSTCFCLERVDRALVSYGEAEKEIAFFEKEEKKDKRVNNTTVLGEKKRRGRGEGVLSLARCARITSDDHLR